jgi:hypothetical protein
LRNTLDERRLHIRPERQRDNFGAGLLGTGEFASSGRTRGECRLEMQRNGIVNSRCDPPVEQMLAELVSSLGPDDIQVIHRFRRAREEANTRTATKYFIVAICKLAAALVPTFKVGKKSAEKAALQIVQPRVDAGDGADVTPATASIAKDPDPLSDRWIVCRNRSSVSQGAEILGRIEAVGDPIRIIRKWLAAAFRGVSLAGVLDYRYAKLPEFLQRTGLTVKMNRENGSGPAGDPLRYRSGVKQQRVRIYVGKSHTRSGR